MKKKALDNKRGISAFSLIVATTLMAGCSYSSVEKDYLEDTKTPLEYRLTSGICSNQVPELSKVELKDNNVVTVSLEKQISFNEVYVPRTTSYNGIPIHYYGFKAFESYTTLKGCKQYDIQQVAITDEFGFRKIICETLEDSEATEERYLVAVGTSVSPVIGTYVDIVLEDGTMIPCIVGDIKQDVHTDITNTITSVYPQSPCCSEFIVDTYKISTDVLGAGNCSKFFGESPVSYFKVYDKTI